MSNEVATDGGGEKQNKEEAGPRFIYSAFSAAAWIVLIHELLERFSFYGMKGILTYYLNDYLGFDDDTSTIIYHLFTAISYVTPILGTFVSDNFLGRYKTIVFLGIIYLIGHLLMPLTALVRNQAGPIISMFILAIGTGAIKPCVAAFGGDQVEPGRDDVLDAFFAFFYMCINIGAFASQLLTPILREQVKCIDDSCYPLAFGVPAIAFGLCYVIFLAGTPKYKIFPKPSQPMLNKAFSVIASGKLKSGVELSDEPQEDGSPSERDFVNDVKQSLRVCFLFLPFPIYWSLFDQQGSRWVLQGKRMDGYISEGFSLTADQMQSVNPLLIVLVVPIFNNIIYPLLAKCGQLKTPTSRIFVGYLVCAGAFGLTGIMDLIVDSRLPVQPENVAQVRVFNSYNCDIRIATNQTVLGENQLSLKSGDVTTLQYSSPVLNSTTIPMFTFTSACGSAAMTNAYLSPAEGTTSLVVLNNGHYSAALPIPYVVSDTKLRFVYIGNQANPTVRFGESDDSCKPSSNLTQSNHFTANSYCEIARRQSVEVAVNGQEIGKVDLNSEDTINFVTVVGIEDNSTGEIKMHRVLDLGLNPLHITLQLPQYLLMCISEVLFSVTALAFAYSEAPESLKSLLQSAYLVSIFFGNMIVIAVAAAPKLPRQAYEFFLFAGLVFIGGFVQLYVISVYNKMKFGSDNAVKPIEIDMDEQKKFNNQNQDDDDQNKTALSSSRNSDNASPENTDQI